MRKELSRKERDSHRREYTADDKVVIQTEAGPRELDAWIVAAMQQLEIQENARAKGLSVGPAMDRELPRDVDLLVSTYASGLPILDALARTDLDDLTPRQAFELVARLKEAMEKEGWKWER